MLKLIVEMSFVFTVLKVLSFKKREREKRNKKGRLAEMNKVLGICCFNNIKMQNLSKD